jgi:osmotically-inducible protein OsmY
MRALLMLALAALLTGCKPYVAVVSVATQTYRVATDLRSVSTQAADTAIEAKIKAALLTSPVAGTASISVYCRQGVVVLAGALPPRSPAGFAAVQIARETSGVERVETFYVNVQPALADDLALKAKIQASLITDPRLKAGQVDVAVYGGHVLLVGVVDSWQQVEDFREDVRAVSGVLSVRSYVQVGAR